jgi:hypothetical protein
MGTGMVEPKTTMSPGRALAWLIAGLIAAIFFAGVAAGFLEAAAEDGFDKITPSFGGTVVGLTIASITLLLTAPSLPRWQAMSPRRRLYWGSLGGSALLGAVIGIMLMIDGASGRDAASLLTDGPLSPDFAIAVAALYVIGLTAACLAYHRAIDDHEERAWLWAGLAGWYAFVLPAPAWWVLRRAAVAPPVDAMALFILSLLVNAIVWLWLKFR